MDIKQVVEEVLNSCKDFGDDLGSGELGQQRASKMSIEDFMRLLDAFLERNIHFKQKY